MNIESLNKLISSFYKLASDPVFKARELLGVREDSTEEEINLAFNNKKYLVPGRERYDDLMRQVGWMDKMKNNYPPQLKSIVDRYEALSDAKRLLVEYLVKEEEEEQAEPVKTYPANQQFLYHITFYRNMSSISSGGLMPGSGELLGHGGNAGRSSGSIFLTDKSSISHWYNKIEQMAEYSSDNILQDEVVPVVLRTPKLNDDKQDDTAEQVGMYDEYVRPHTISPDQLEIWNGTQWVPVSDYEQIDLESALDAQPADEDEDGDGDGDDNIYYYFKDSSSNPLLPN